MFKKNGRKKILSLILTFTMICLVLPNDLCSVIFNEKNVYADDLVYQDGNSQYTYSIDTDNNITILKYAGSDTDLTIPDSINGHKVKYIGDNAFENCSGISKITIPEGVTKIGEFAFTRCYSLTTIKLPEGLISLGQYSFYQCISLASISIPKGVTEIGSFTFHGCKGLKSINIPASVTSIGSYAFAECSGLTSIKLPEGLTSIDNGVFSKCSGLTSITIPTGITSIGFAAFEQCSGLSSITIPDGVTKIEAWTFDYCSGLKNITLPEGLTDINGESFIGCTALTSINIPDGVTWVGPMAFKDCTSLKSMIFPKGVLKVNSKVLSGCSSLAQVTIPENVNEIGEDAFLDCTNIFRVENKSDLTIDSTIFNTTKGWYSKNDDKVFNESFLMGKGIYVQPIKLVHDYTNNDGIFKGDVIKWHIEPSLNNYDYLSDINCTVRSLDESICKIDGDSIVAVGEGTTDIVVCTQNTELYRETLKVYKLNPSVSYCTHVQDIGWQSYVNNGALSGTTGQAKRLEELKLNLTMLD